MTVASKKQDLRERARARRAELSRALPDFARRIAQFADALPVSSAALIGGYQALAEEADPSRLLDALRTRGCEVAYPRVHMKAQPLWFHVPLPQEPWASGAFGIPEPRPDWPRAFPSILLVPLLAFDADGYRLGYGGGYYDRTLADFRGQHSAIAIGIAFAGQEFPQVPREPIDQRLVMLVTDLGVRLLSGQ
jgi:5-formyltetrahydrofolate cyclo-ligase